MDDRQAHVESQVKREIAEVARDNWKMAAASASYLRWQASFKPDKRAEADQATQEAQALRDKARRAADDAAKARRLACFRGRQQEEAGKPAPLSQLQRPLKPPSMKTGEE